MWRSLVAHLHGVQGVEGSNPFTPTIGFKGLALKRANPFVFFAPHLLAEQIDELLPEPHIGRFAVVFGMPKQFDGDIWNFEGQGRSFKLKWFFAFLGESLWYCRNQVRALQNMTYSHKVGNMQLDVAVDALTREPFPHFPMSCVG